MQYVREDFYVLFPKRVKNLQSVSPEGTKLTKCFLIFDYLGEFWAENQSLNV